MLKNLSLRSKLILILVGVSLLAASIVITLGYFVGVESITTEVYERLTSARNAKAFEIEEYFNTETDIVEVLGSSEYTAVAIQELAGAFRQIADSDTINCTRDLEEYYTRFLDSLDRNLEVRRDIQAYYPNSAAACYLQYHYLSNSPAPEAPYTVVAAQDNSDYSDAHSRYHPFFREALERFGFYDIFLIDLQTRDIVYTVMKETDFATSLMNGPYRNSNLAALVDKVERNADLREAQIVDFAFYRPSFGAPAAFMGVPVYFRGELVGVLAAQLSLDKINRIMNYGGAWAENGLGQTGEVLLVGEDFRLRSDPRRYLENKEAFLRDMATENVSEEMMEKLESVGPVLVTELRTENIERALRGESNIVKLEGYHGDYVLSAFTPLDLPGGTRWALVTEISEPEAMAPVRRFRNLNLAAMALIIILITILAMIITRSLIRPIDKLTAGAVAVKAGDTDVRIENNSNDEFGRLTRVFNSMVVSIDEQKKEIIKQAEENNDLLYSRFPDSIAERYRNGESNIVDRFEGVTVLSADIRGTGSFADINPDEGWPIVQEISEKFNGIAVEMGMEVISAMPDGYLCVCGMNIPRLDNARRIVILSMRFREVIAEVNKKYDLDLHLNVGLTQGPVLAGILDDQTKNYVVWGPTIDAAQRLSYLNEEDQTVANNTMMDLLAGNFHFTRVREFRLTEGKKTKIGTLVGRVADLKAAGIDLDDPTLTTNA